MLEIITYPSRKAIKWLKFMDIPFDERTVKDRPLTKSELKYFLSFTEHGIDDILRTRSEGYRNMSAIIDTLSINEVLTFLVEHPEMIRLPIIFDGRACLIGFNKEKIRCFIPRFQRRRII